VTHSYEYSRREHNLEVFNYIATIVSREPEIDIMSSEMHVQKKTMLKRMHVQENACLKKSMSKKMLVQKMLVHKKSKFKKMLFHIKACSKKCFST